MTTIDVEAAAKALPLATAALAGACMWIEGGGDPLMAAHEMKKTLREIEVLLEQEPGG